MIKKTKQELAQVLSLELQQNFKAQRFILARNQTESKFLSDWLKKELIKPAQSDLKTGHRLALKPDYLECYKCGPRVVKKNISGTGQNRILIILHNPFEFKRKILKKEQEESKILLQKMIKALKINLNDCYLTYLAKCDSPDIFRQPSKVINNCLPYLEEELKKVNPLIVITVGSSLALNKIKNKYSDISWYQLDHPLSLLKDASLKRIAWETLKTIMKDPHYSLALSLSS